MILSDLIPAIRATDEIKARYWFGPVVQQKGSLIQALKSYYGRKDETGLSVTEDGFLTKTGDMDND